MDTMSIEDPFAQLLSFDSRINLYSRNMIIEVNIASSNNSKGWDQKKNPRNRGQNPQNNRGSNRGRGRGRIPQGRKKKFNLKKHVQSASGMNM